jgi:hypothetical protein
MLYPVFTVLAAIGDQSDSHADVQSLAMISVKTGPRCV